jgi:peptidoglycan/xylan/chitin deacetylase (PgdA/CDA1 family)
MMAYQVKTPWWLSKLLYRKLVWKMPPGEEPSIYLTFDDGPHPVATPFVLAQLQRFDAKASFFCIGKNVSEHPAIYQGILAAGHAVCNHTNNHYNGWKYSTEAYLDNIREAAEKIDSKGFRPPYGRIRKVQASMLRQAGWKIYMWDVLSGDFDTSITPQKCLENTISNMEPGSIVVFHDSEKAWERMSYTLPRVLEYCKEKNWNFKALPTE